MRSSTREEGRHVSATLRLGRYSILTTEPATRCPLYLVYKSSRAKCLHITAFPQATPNRGALVSLRVTGH